MLKNWIAEVIALALSFGTQATLEGAQTPPTGNQIVQQMDEAYQKGEYNAFLTALHAHYETAGKAGALRGIFESAKKAMQKTHHEILTSLKLKRHEVAKLSKERNQRLLHAVSENPDLDIVQKVDSVVFSSITDEQNDILTELEALKFEIPETAQATIENKISAIETEYYIKSLLLDIGDHMTKEEMQDLEKKKIILGLAKLDKMFEAANEYGEKKWAEKIEKAKGAYRAQKAFTIDYEVLQNLARGKFDPQNSVEEKVKEIMMDYLNQREQTLSEIAIN